MYHWKPEREMQGLECDNPVACIIESFILALGFPNLTYTNADPNSWNLGCLARDDCVVRLTDPSNGQIFWGFELSCLDLLAVVLAVLPALGLEALRGPSIL